MEGPIGRQRRTKAERAQIAAEGLVPGTSVTEVARRNGTTRWQVYDWRKKLWEPSTHVRDPGRQPDPRVARHRDHVIRPSTSPRTDASAAPHCTAPTRSSCLNKEVKRRADMVNVQAFLRTDGNHALIPHPQYNHQKPLDHALMPSKKLHHLDGRARRWLQGCQYLSLAQAYREVPFEG